MHIIEREAGDMNKLHLLVRAERDAEQRDRLRVAALALQGLQSAEVRRMLGLSRGFVQR